jgi:hypothetical protein
MTVAVASSTAPTTTYSTGVTYSAAPSSGAFPTVKYSSTGAYAAAASTSFSLKPTYAAVPATYSAASAPHSVTIPAASTYADHTAAAGAPFTYTVPATYAAPLPSLEVAPHPQASHHPAEPVSTSGASVSSQAFSLADVQSPQDFSEPPKSLTAGLPTPAAIAEQKQAYERALDQQMEAGKRKIQEQTGQALQILREAAEQKKLQLSMQVDEQLMEKEFSLDQQTHEQIMKMQEDAFHRKSQLEEQANALILEYKQRQMKEAMEKHVYEHKLKEYDARQRVQQLQKERMQKGALGAEDFKFTQAPINGGNSKAGPVGSTPPEHHNAVTRAAENVVKNTTSFMHSLSDGMHHLTDKNTTSFMHSLSDGMHHLTDFFKHGH